MDHPGVQLIGQYRIKSPLGEGNFGRVLLGAHVVTGEEVAIKIIEKRKIQTQQQMERLKREVRMLNLVNHPNIVQLYDVMNSETSIVLIMEHASGGEVFQYIKRTGRIREKEANRLFRQVLSAIAYCHMNFIVHRDIKPENLLLDSQKNVKIIDFGLCNFYQPENFLKTFCGSAYYAAPEMITGTAYTGPEVDIWSLGIVLYVLLCGALPFHDDNQARLFDKILNGAFQCPDDISLEARDLLSRMIVVNPAQRLTITQVLVHPWITAESGEVPLFLPQRFHPIEPDDRFLQQLPSHGCNIERVKEGLQLGVFNPETSVYHLLVQKAQDKEARAQSQLPPLANHGAAQYPGGHSLTQREAYLRLKKNNRKTFAAGDAATDAAMDAAKVRYLKGQTETQASSTFLAPVSSAIPPVPLQPEQSTDSVGRNPQPTDQDRNRRFHSLDPARMATLAMRAAQQFGEQALQPAALPIQSEPAMGLRVANGWLFDSKTSSSRHPDDIRNEIIRVLTANNVEHALDQATFQCHWQRDDKVVRFTIEICKIAMLPLNGLHFTRWLGETWVYNELYNQLISQMKL